MSEDASLRLLLEMVECGTFVPSVPGDLREIWKTALKGGLVAQFDDDDCALTEAGRARLARMREGPDYWAWPFKPLHDVATPRCHHAKARTPLTPRWNLEKYRFSLHWLTALPNPGEDFGVKGRDNNRIQEQLGYGHRYYVPTPEDLSIVEELFPSANPGNPPWNQIETELVIANHEKRDLRRHNAPTLIRLLQKARRPKSLEAASGQADGAGVFAEITKKLAAVQALLGKSNLPARDWPGMFSPPLDSTMGEISGIAAVGIQAKEARQKMRELVAQLRGADPGDEITEAVLDIFAREYRWTAKEFADLTDDQILMHLRQIIANRQKPGAKRTKQASRLRRRNPNAERDEWIRRQPDSKTDAQIAKELRARIASVESHWKPIGKTQINNIRKKAK